MVDKYLMGFGGFLACGTFGDDEKLSFPSEIYFFIFSKMEANFSSCVRSLLLALTS